MSYTCYEIINVTLNLDRQFVVFTKIMYLLKTYLGLHNGHSTAKKK